MHRDLEPIKEILSTFLNEIQEIKRIHQSISAPQMATAFSVSDRQPIFDSTQFIPESDAFLEEETAYMLLYADARNFRAYMHRPKLSETPQYYQQPALPVYLQWRQQEKEVFHRRCEQIPEPNSGISLAGYLQQLALTASEENEHRDVWIESLRCFLQFLREDTELDQKGGLEILFPSHENCKGMELRKGYRIECKGKKIKKVGRQYILRRIEETVFPIDILAASEILMNLTQTVLKGRPNVQRSAAEALGFAWLCHAVGCYRVVTREDLVFNTKIGSIKLPEKDQPKEWFQPTHFIGITSLFGTIDLPISKTLCQFLLALPRDQGSDRIFSMNLDSLLRTFRDKGVKQSPRTLHLGTDHFSHFYEPTPSRNWTSSFFKKRKEARKAQNTKE
jgi:hypothetical protein